MSVTKTQLIDGLGSSSFDNINVTGSVTGNVTGSVTGNLTGDVTGSVNSTGISTFSGGIELGTGTTISSPASNEFSISTNGSERVRVDSSGRVGVGTDNPGATLDVDAPSTTALKLRVSPGGYNAIEFNSGNNGGNTSFSINDNAVVNGAGAVAINQYDSNGSYARTAMILDGSGRVTMPYQPSFSAYGSASQIVSSAGWTKATIWTAEHFDTGNNFASDRFTAPVTGRYLFGTNVRVDGIGSDYWRVLISKNSSTSVNTNGHSLTRYEVNGAGNYHTMAVTAFFSLAANDYVEVYVESNTDTSYTIHFESQFWGHLVG